MTEKRFSPGTGAQPNRTVTDLLINDSRHGDKELARGFAQSRVENVPNMCDAGSTLSAKRPHKWTTGALGILTENLKCR